MLRAEPHTRLPALLAVVLGAVFLIAFIVRAAAILAHESEFDQSTFDTVETSLLINEIDSRTPGINDREFIELYDGGRGDMPLDGLSIVLFSGHNDGAYASFDLNGFSTNEQGYFILGSRFVAGVDLVMADSLLQNGADAVALYHAAANEFPVGTPISTEDLIDAIVYGTGQADDEGLLVLLLPGEMQANENSHTLAEFHSLQRCPNGSGGQRRTNAYQPFEPTPKGDNGCDSNGAPTVVRTNPAPDAHDIALDSSITVTFSEAVAVIGEWYELTCTRSGSHEASTTIVSDQVSLFPLEPFVNSETCEVTIRAGQVRDLDSDDPPDLLSKDHSWYFTVLPARQMLINEVDADTPGVDTEEFIELYDGGAGATPLDGLALVFFNGANGQSYRAIDLDGYVTDQEGYFLLGNTAVVGVDHSVPNGALQNGLDAVALYDGEADVYPNGTVATADDLLDALIYSTGDEASPHLEVLLHDGERAVDEDGRDAKDVHSNQRCPNGAGGQRRTGAYLQNRPTPKAANFCAIDAPPRIRELFPADQSSGAAPSTILSVTFSEAVTMADGAVSLTCTKSGTHQMSISGGPSKFQLRPKIPLDWKEVCTAKVKGSLVADIDSNDPPDGMDGDSSWSFETKSIAVARHLLINEVDVDTEGVDTAEFIELFDGGSGQTALEGLAVVLINGSKDQAYRKIDLAGYKTDGKGYFVIGGSAVPGVNLAIANGVIQNGPDAIALYAADEYEEDGRGKPLVGGLLDALVYHTNDEADPGLSYLLLKNEVPVNEAKWRDAAVDSNQRCPNGKGGQRKTAGFMQNQPTPGSTNNCTLDTPPQVAEVFPADGAVNAAVDSKLFVEFNEPVKVEVNWIQVSCERQGSLDLFPGGGPKDYEISVPLLMPFDSCSASIEDDKVRDLDGFADPLSDDFNWQFSTGGPAFGACAEDAAPIHAVQGSGASSPISGTLGVTVEGIVVGDFQGAKALGGIFLQEETANHDENPHTSEGIFVSDAPGFEVKMGDVVRLQGDVVEQAGMTSIVNVSEWRLCSSGSVVKEVPVSLPLPEKYSKEAYEGMAVTFLQPLTVNGSERLGSDGIVDLASERLYSPTQIASPGAAALVVAQVNRRKQIGLDDGRFVRHPLPTPPYLGPNNTLRLSDTTTGITGIMAEYDGVYRLQPLKVAPFQRNNPRPDLVKQVPGSIRVGHINSGGYFNGSGNGRGFAPGHGAQSQVEYLRQRKKLVSALLALDASIVGLTRVENDGFGEKSAIGDLIGALNAASAADQVYAAVVIPGDGLAQFLDRGVLIYREDLVTAVGEPLILDSAPFESGSRRPVGQRFVDKVSGEQFVVVLVQFPERDDCPAREDKNADQGDGQGCWNLLRQEAASALAAWVNQLREADGHEVVILGDFNSFREEDPLRVLKTAGLVHVAAGAEEKDYSVVIDGEAGTLNDGFTTPGLKAAQVQRWHINADEPAALDYRDLNQPSLYTADVYRSAPRDPLVIDLAPGLAVQITLPIIAAP